MIRNLLVLGLLAVSLTPGQIGPAALYCKFEHKPPASVFQSVQEEVALLLAPDNLHFEWIMMPSSGDRAWTELAIIQFSGQCESLPFASNSFHQQALGWTDVRQGETLPFAHVDCDAIRDFVLKPLLERPPQLRVKLLGRAIGRVTAHELLHIFSRAVAHSGHGVDRSNLTASELLDDRGDLYSWDSDVHMVHPAAAAASRTVAASAAEGKASYQRGGCASCHGPKGQGTSHGPKLRIHGRLVDSFVLAAVLTKSQDKMFQRARSMKIAAPTLDEEELPHLLRYLIDFDR
jgi:mono/diheme cytochrome c family protein